MGGGKIGVDVFILITGYFLIEDEAEMIKIKKVLKLWGQIIFYSILLFVFGELSAVNISVLSVIKNLIQSLFPITYSLWWFASTYFILYFIHPFINKLINSLNIKMYQNLLIMLIIFWCIIPTISTREFEGNSLLWFITLYLVSGYARKYGFNPNLKAKQYLIIASISIVFMYGTNFIFTILGCKWGIFFNHANYFFAQNRIPVFVISISLFMAFTMINMKYNKWINTIASTTFGVYLIHDSKVLRKIIWIDIFKNYTYQNSLLIILHSIIAVCIVFITCSIIDLIRKKFFERIYIKVIDFGVQLVCNTWKKININMNIKRRIFGD